MSKRIFINLTATYNKKNEDDFLVTGGFPSSAYETHVFDPPTEGVL